MTLEAKNVETPDEKHTFEHGDVQVVNLTGMTVGLALALALVLELYFGVGRLAMDGGHWVLALGLAFDCCARVLGTVAAGRAGQPAWAWWCIIGGSPAVAAFTLFGDERLSTEPGPIAGHISVLAIGLVAIAVIGAALHI